jgi:hypothetical protein
MQGYVYGPRITEAAPYSGVIEFFQACRAAGIRVSIISHKTKHPFLGEKHDLHAAAQNWLEQQGFFDPARIGLPRENAFFELTKQAKLERIAACGCTHFIDDLPEFLGEAAFPKAALRILFDSNDLYAADKRFVRALDWQAARDLFFLPCRSRGDETLINWLNESGNDQSLVTSAPTLIDTRAIVPRSGRACVQWRHLRCGEFPRRPPK